MGYIHIKVEAEQISKKPGKPCGDVYYFERNPNKTTIILSDGLGSGVKANIAATMCVARLRKLIHGGFSLRHAVTNVVQTMTKAVRDNQPYAVFSVARIMNDGVATILSYEMPPPIFISKNVCTLLNQKTIAVDKATICEANCYLNVNDAIMLVSDGIVQAGLGHGLPFGWGSDNLCRYVNHTMKEGTFITDLPLKVQKKSIELCNGNTEDDSSVIVAHTKPGISTNIMTGPPSVRTKDPEMVRNFLNHSGYKIVCGGTTANIVAKYLNQRVNVDNTFADHFTPPKYLIEGIDLVTEGAITLNQLYNIIDEDREMMDDTNPVTELYDFVMRSDRINFLVGKTFNPATAGIRFIQQGLLTRDKIIPLLSEKLQALGKLVVIEEI